MGFPKDFVWGVATASYQIEGAAYEDGKGPSVWDMFCREKGRIFEGQTGDVACDHYHRMREDVALMRELGVKNYRFSISWPRIFPQGTGEVNEKGLKFYEDLVDELLANGITPYCTLFHWDYPYALHERGGWLNRESVGWYCGYVETVARRLGGKLKNFLTFNEPACFIGLGYGTGNHAPGIIFPRRDLIKMCHHVLLAHAEAVRILRREVPGCRVGYAPCADTYYPVTDSPEDVEAARKATFGYCENFTFSTSWWSDAILLGEYPREFVEAFGDEMPQGWREDLKTMREPLDYYCHNIYRSVPVKSDGKGGWQEVLLKPGHGRTAIGWTITPEALYWPPKFFQERYGTPLMITENGLSLCDVVSLDGKVHDPNRIDYLTRYLRELRRAVDDGVDLRGYFQWSFMDNMEWARGYDERFGLVYVDFETQQRIPKDSAYWYKEVMEKNGENL